MFGFLEDIGKAALGIVTLPLALAEDITDTVGLTEGTASNTKQRVIDIQRNVENSVKPDWRK